jgi:hypothetical protein
VDEEAGCEERFEVENVGGPLWGEDYVPEVLPIV